MNGFIEIYVDDVLRYRWLFTLRDYDSFSFKDQVDLRESDLKKIIDSLIENVVPNFDPARTQFQIAYESKMNEDDYSKMFDDGADDLHNEKTREGNRQGDGTFADSGTF